MNCPVPSKNYIGLFMALVSSIVVAGECPSSDSLTSDSIILVEQACLALDEWEKELIDESLADRNLSNGSSSGFAQIKQTFDEMLKQKLQVEKPIPELPPGENLESFLQKATLNGVNFARNFSKFRKVEEKLKGLEKLSYRRKSKPFLAAAKNRSRKLKKVLDDAFNSYQQKIAKLGEFEASTFDTALKAVRLSDSSACVTAVLPWMERHVTTYQQTQTVDLKTWRTDLSQIEGCWDGGLSGNKKRISGQR